MIKVKNCKYCKKSFKKDRPEIHFLCPTDGLIHQENVIFLCNRCKQKDLILKNGIYFCPTCLTEQSSFKCLICKSNKVEIFSENKNKKK